MAPLNAIDSAESTFFDRTSIFEAVPDGDLVVLEIFGGLTVAGNKPEHFDNGPFERSFFGGEERKAVAKVETKLSTEDGFERTDAAGLLGFAVFKNVCKKFEILIFGVDGFVIHGIHSEN